MKYLVLIIILITLLYFSFSFKTKEFFFAEPTTQGVVNFVDLRGEEDGVEIVINWFMDFSINKNIIIKPGQTVNWKVDDTNHKLIWDKYGSPEPMSSNNDDGSYDFSSSTQKKIKFTDDNNNNQYTYTCGIHGDNMKGSIKVSTAPTTTVAVPTTTVADQIAVEVATGEATIAALVQLPNDINLSISNKKLTLHNIVSIDNDAHYDNLDVKSCVLHSECGDGRCIINEHSGSGKCFNVVKNLYQLDGTRSYIKLEEIDNLDTHFKFVLLFNDTLIDNPIIIVDSGIDVWSIIIDDNKFILKINENSKEYKLEINQNTLYKFEIIVSSSTIKCIITTDNGDTEEQSINFIDEKIYDCKDVRLDNRYKKCSSNIIGATKRYKFQSAPLYFGGNPNDVDGEDYFKGYIGDFEFDLNKDKCLYIPDNNGILIKDGCIKKCIENEGCNKTICEDKCKDIKECYFDSKINSSRHSIDCINKCIIPENKCSSEYCNKQCNTCGDECYWVKQTNYLDDDEYAIKGRPYPPLIELPTFSYDGTKARFKWMQSKEGIGGKTNGYIALLYKTYKKKEGLRIEWIDINICTNMCDYVISNLIPEETYTIGIKAYNASGSGMLSNLITFKTKKHIINTIILNNIKPPNNKEIGNFNRCKK
jgi:hypothetical protein